MGFDLRESDFPLKAEFPIFISNAIHYLGDTSLLAGNIYMAGDRVLFHPQADLDVNTLSAETCGTYGIFFAAKHQATGIAMPGAACSRVVDAHLPGVLGQFAL